jgi:hypothetical protein
MYETQSTHNRQKDQTKRGYNETKQQKKGSALLQENKGYE